MKGILGMGDMRGAGSQSVRQTDRQTVSKRSKRQKKRARDEKGKRETCTW